MVHASTPATALIAYGAEVELTAADGATRTIPLQEFLLAPPGDLIVPARAHNVVAKDGRPIFAIVECCPQVRGVNRPRTTSFRLAMRAQRPVRSELPANRASLRIRALTVIERGRHECLHSCVRSTSLTPGASTLAATRA
jgi:CO/xanthine dehydrogenase FAD-binding subunit